METKDFGLSKGVIEKILKVISFYPEVEKVYLYGSRAKGTHRPGSDIDLVIVAPKMSFDRYLALYTQLEELDLPYLIDLTKEDLLTQEIREHIKRVGKEIYSKINQTKTNQDEVAGQ